MNNQPTCANDPKHKTKTTINLPLQAILTLPAPRMSLQKRKEKNYENKNQAGHSKKQKSTNEPTCTNRLGNGPSRLQNGPSGLGNSWSRQSDGNYLVGGKVKQ